MLKDRGIEQVVVAGLAQDVCVKETVLDALRSRVRPQPPNSTASGWAQLSLRQPVVFVVTPALNRCIRTSGVCPTTSISESVACML